MRRFGNATLLHEDSRAVWNFRWVETLAQDLSFALRLMRRNSGFTGIAVLTLALGIGGNSLVFSLLDAVVLRPLPFADPGRLFTLATVEAETQRAMNSSYSDFRDWQQQNRTFQALAAYRTWSFNLTGMDEPERVDALVTTPGLFELLGMRPILGRSFVAGDDERVALLSHGLWTRRFGGDPAIVGRSALLDGHSYIILGVLPPGFHFPPNRFSGDPEAFVPLTPGRDRTSWELRVIGRLRSDVTEQEARVEMNAIGARLAQTYPSNLRRQGIKIDPFQRSIVADSRKTALILMGAVGFVLLIACGNVANLLLSHGAARWHEIAIRAAIGASRGRLIRQLLMESILLAALGGAMGIVLAYCGLPLLTALAPERTAFFTRVRDEGVHLDLTVLAFTAAVSLGSAFLFGVMPALKSTAPAASSARYIGHGRLRGALMALEVSFAFVLLAGAGLMMNSMVRLLSVDLGFHSEHLLTMEVDLPRAKFSDLESSSVFYRRALQRLAALPDVVSIGATSDLPLAREYSINTVDIPGSPPVTGRAAFHEIDPGYFEVMGTPLIRGRLFTNGDSEQSASVAIINRSMANRYWPKQDPIGRTVVATRGIEDRTPQGTHLRFVKESVEIVGIVGDVRLIALDVNPAPELFFPFTQRPTNGMSLVLRTAANPAYLIPAVKKEIWRVDPDLPVTNIRSMDALVSTDVAQRRFVLLLIGAFALMAVILSAAGIYGVVSYTVHQRSQEIGIRMALGAQERQVVWLFMRQIAAWVLLGMVAGTSGATALTRLLATQLYEIKPTDPMTFALAAAVMLAVALVAIAAPVYRATRIDPAETLRYE